MIYHKHKERKELAEEMKETLPELFNFMLDETAKRTGKTEREVLAEVKHKLKKE